MFAWMQKLRRSTYRQVGEREDDHAGGEFNLTLFPGRSYGFATIGSSTRNFGTEKIF
jgi:hypothetical protein